MEYIYDISQFYWNKEANTFYANAWDLVAFLPDGSFHPDAFPNGKEQFFIRNYETGGFRRFRFVEPLIDLFYETDETGEVFQCIEITSWLFESEDGINCSVCIEA
jgi:hypothetical protein